DIAAEKEKSRELRIKSREQAAAAKAHRDAAPSSGVIKERSPREESGESDYRTRAVPDGAELLGRVYDFLGEFVVYPSDHAHVAHVLWIVHTHLMQAWESTPRIAFLSPEPAFGKSRALEITGLLVPRPVETVSVTAGYLLRKLAAPGP